MKSSGDWIQFHVSRYALENATNIYADMRWCSDSNTELVWRKKFGCHAKENIHKISSNICTRRQNIKKYGLDVESAQYTADNEFTIDW